STTRRTRGRRRTSPAFATATQYPVSHAKVSVQKTRPSASIPANDVPNCGSRLVKKIAIFGFPRLLKTPWRNRSEEHTSELQSRSLHDALPICRRLGERAAGGGRPRPSRRRRSTP